MRCLPVLIASVAITGLTAEVRVVPVHRRLRPGGVGQPPGDLGHPAGRARVEEGVHRPAPVVPADDDVGDAEGGDGVLDGGRLAGRAAGRPGDEETLLSFAAQMEKLSEWLNRRAPLKAPA